MPSTPLASGQSEGMSSDYTKHAPPKRITPPPRELERWSRCVVRCGGRSGLPRTRSRDLQIQALICKCLEDEATLTLS